MREMPLPGLMGSSRIGLGLAAIGRPVYITVGRNEDLGYGGDRTIDGMRQKAHELLDAVWNLGLRHFDAARSYGRAEQFLATWLALHPCRRSNLTIGSKWGYQYIGDWKIEALVRERKEHSMAMLNRQWQETREALGSLPDVYLIHSLTPDSSALTDNALLERLRDIAELGVRVGFSTSGPSQSDVIRAAMDLPYSPFSAVQATWNILEPSAGSALEAVKECGWFVVLKEVLAVANGRLIPTGAEKTALALAAEDGQALDRFAIGAALARPWADIVLTGAVPSKQLRENVAAATPVLADERILVIAEVATQYWAERAARTWT